MGIINKAKKFINKISLVEKPSNDDFFPETKLVVRGNDLGPIYWVETNYLAKSHIIHCKNGDYEL